MHRKISENNPILREKIMEFIDKKLQLINYN